MLALEVGLPAVVGVGDSLDAITDGIQVVVDAKRGVVYERPHALWRHGD
jgi:phosphohistidine swiveling domain-containing protein